MLILTLRDVEKCLRIEDCLLAVERAFNLLAINQANILPNRMFHNIKEDFAWVFSVGGYILEDNVFTIKVLASNKENPEKLKIPHMFGMIGLFDAVTGMPLCLMEGTLITGMRTGAVAGLGAKYLARENARKIVVIGSKYLAGNALIAMERAVPSLNHAIVFSRTRKSVDSFVEEMRQKVVMRIEAGTNMERSLKEADIVLTTTSSDEPVIHYGNIKPGTFVAAIGSKQEVDLNILQHSRVVAERIAECKNYGRCGLAIKGGYIAENKLIEFADIISGKVKGRVTEDEIVILDSIGLAIEDVAVANLVYAKAKEMELGTEINMFETARVW
jgi:ornithine cyclodeaminase/alanine dehydrogenase-like protein (mu-crystallin family)